MNERQEIEVDRVVKPKKVTCCTQAWQALDRLERRHCRMEFRLKLMVAEVRAVTKDYSEGTIITCISSQMCANAAANHAVHYDAFERVGRGLYRRYGAQVPRRAVPGDPDGFLRREFHMTVVNLLAHAQRQWQFDPKILRSMVDHAGAIDAARLYIFTSATEDELNQLCRLGGLNHTIEALVLHPHFAPLFNAEERHAARRRLVARDVNAPRRQNQRQADPAPPRTYLPWSVIQSQYRD